MRYERAADAFAAARTLNDALPLSHLEILSPAVAASFEAAGKFLMYAGFSGSSSEIDYQAGKIRELVGSHDEILDDEGALRRYPLLRDIDFHTKPLAAQIAAAPPHLAPAAHPSAAESRPHAGVGLAQIFLHNQPSTQSPRNTSA